MNYLAHIFLAGDNPEAQLGGLLGDFSKPGFGPSYSEIIEREIRLHRMVDTFTDSHDVVLSAKRKFSKDSRRFSGIILDVLYDHFLASRWKDYSKIELEEFTQRFYRYLKTVDVLLPERLRLVAPMLIREDWLSSYTDYDGFVRTVHRLTQRLSKGRKEMVSGLDEVPARILELQTGFDLFFPELQGFVQQQRSHLVG